MARNLALEYLQALILQSLQRAGAMTALAQTDWNGPALSAENWREIIRTQIESVSWEWVSDDVRPFLVMQQEAEFLTKENLVRSLGSGQVD